MRGQALTDYCAKNFEQREHCCFGISPFNSYFSEERIRELALWGKREFGSMSFFVPDVPAVYTLEAQGYSRDKAEWKARRQAQYLKNKIRKALASCSISDDEASEMILDWERLTSIPRYTNLLDEVTALFETNENFRASCLEASRWVLMQKASDSEQLTERSLEIAVKYFLSEIPLFKDTAGIVGKAASVFCYHQRVKFLENFYERKLAYAPSANQGFVILNPSKIEDAVIANVKHENIESVAVVEAHLLERPFA
jgi:cyclo(L-tyrosyl-L-tyrosyl) synthase